MVYADLDMSYASLAGADLTVSQLEGVLLPRSVMTSCQLDDAARRAAEKAGAQP